MGLSHQPRTAIVTGASRGNAVAPGPVPTELLLSGRSEEVLRRLADAIPLGRLGQPEDIAGIVSFLAGTESGWISGQVIRANGGRN